MRKITFIIYLSLFLDTAYSQEKLYNILKEYLPYTAIGKSADSLFAYYKLNKNFVTDSISSAYLKGELKNFNPSGLNPNKLLIQISRDEQNSFSYIVRVCLDSSITSKKIVQDKVENIYNQVAGFFAKNIERESGKKDKFPYKLYNFYSQGSTFPDLLVGWGYNQSLRFTGYYYSITLFLNEQN